MKVHFKSDLALINL